VTRPAMTAPCDGVLTYAAMGGLGRQAGPESVAYRSAPGQTEGVRHEASVCLYYRDSYGRVHRDRGSEGRLGGPARFFVTALMVLAAIVVLAALIP
jgi:hypothetical protein